MEGKAAPDELRAVLVGASSAKCECARCVTLYGVLKRAWFALSEIEKGAKSLRKSLPEEDPARMRLLTLECLAMIQLATPRRVHKDLADLIQGTLDQWATEEEAEGATD